MGEVIRYDEYLLVTLGELGFTPGDVESVGLRVLHHSDPQSAKMARTYQFVNDHLEGLVKGRPGMRIRHVTGEARALLDPAHRRVLRHTARRGDCGTLLCHFKFERAPTALQFVREQHGHWNCETWVDIIDLLSLAAAKEVCIRVLQQAEPIHFSLFGDSLVLMQDKHTHPTVEKRVWFVESSALVEHLTPRVAKLWEDALPIPVLTFDDALNQLHEHETVAVATAMSNATMGEVPEVEGLNEAQVRDALTLLAGFGFATLRGGTKEYVLTVQGKAWAEHLVR
jgi:hypothetical protein